MAMTTDVVLTLGLAAGPAEAGARVIRRAIEQVGAAAASASGTVQGFRRTLETISADRAVGELKRLEAATRAAGVAHAGLGKAASQSLGASLDIGRRLSAYVRDQVRDHDTLRDVLRRTREDLAASKRTTDDFGRSIQGIAQTLVSGLARGGAAAGGFERTLQRLAPQMLRLVFPRQPGAGRNPGSGFNPMALLGGSGRSGSGLPGFGGFGGDLSGWLAEAIPSLFGVTPTTVGMLGTSAAAEGLLIQSVAGPLAGIAPFLPIAAMALPFILGSLFSKKPTVGPNANATVGRLASGGLGIVDRGADNGGNVEAAVELAETAIKALTKTLRQIGATLSDVNSVAGLQVGYFKGKFFVDDTRLGGTATYEKNQFENAEDAVADFVRRALNNADLSGIGDAMRKTLENTKARGFEELGRHIDFARDYERDFKPMEAGVAQIEALTRRFDDLRDTAIELGLEVARVDQAFARERLKLAQDFDREIASGILDRTTQGLIRLTEDAKARLEQARVLGADLAAVDRASYYAKRTLLMQLGEEERKLYLGLLDIAERAAFAVTESLAKMGTESRKLEGALSGAIAASRQAAGGYRQLGESLRDTATSIRLSELSLLSTADKFAATRDRFEEARKAAATGDQDAPRRLGGLARSTLEIGRQFYGSSPEYAALYQEVVGSLGDTAAIQDGIAFQLDAHTVLLDAQLQVLKEIDKRLAKSDEASGALDYLDLSLTRQGTLGDHDKAVLGAQLDRLAALLPNLDPDDDDLGRLRRSASDGNLSLDEAEANAGIVDALRLAAFEELQRQVGADSDVVQAFNTLKTAIGDSARTSLTLAQRLRSLGDVFEDLKGILGGAQSTIVDPAALQALVGSLAGLIKDVGTVVPGDAAAALTAIGDLIRDLPEAMSDVSRIDLDKVSVGLTEIGDAIDGLGRSSGVIRLPGELQEQETAFRSIGDYLDTAGTAPAIDEIVASLDAFTGDSGALGTLRGALAGLKAPTDDMVKAIQDFDKAIADLIKTIGDGNIIGGPRLPEIDRASLSGTGVAQFDTLAGRVRSYIERGGRAGFGEAQLKAGPSWSWAVAERDRIIQSLTTVGDVETLLNRYYGGQRQIVANAADQGANNLVRRLQALGGAGPADPYKPLGPIVRAFLEANPDYGPEGERRVYAPGEQGARNLIAQASDHLVPWRSKYMDWWSRQSELNIDTFAAGGIVSRPTLFGFGDRLGLMGEAGHEAILPLRRGRDGRLGVAANGNAIDPGLLADLVAEVRALRTEVADLRRQQAGEHREAIGQGALFAQRLGGRRAAGGRE